MDISFPETGKKVLNRQAIPSGLNVLVLAPQASDFDAIAITLKLLQQHGNRLFVRVLGSGWNRVLDESCDPPTPDAKTLMRQNELQTSCRTFGLPEGQLGFLHLKEDKGGYIRNKPENAEAIKTAIGEINPGMIFMPHWNDCTNDCRLCATLAWDALESLRLEIPLLHFFTPKTLTMCRQFYTLFGEAEAEWKAGLLQCHQSIRQYHLRQYGMDLAEKIIRLNREVGRDFQNGDYAEAFELKMMTPPPEERPINMKF